MWADLWTDPAMAKIPQPYQHRYGGMYFLIIGSGAPAGTVAEVKAAQSKFLASRNACGANIDASSAPIRRR
jgi:hypothetical protein